MNYGGSTTRPHPGVGGRGRQTFHPASRPRRGITSHGGALYIGGRLATVAENYGVIDDPTTPRIGSPGGLIRQLSVRPRGPD